MMNKIYLLVLVLVAGCYSIAIARPTRLFPIETQGACPYEYDYTQNNGERFKLTTGSFNSGSYKLLAYTKDVDTFVNIFLNLLPAHPNCMTFNMQPTSSGLTVRMTTNKGFDSGWNAIDCGASNYCKVSYVGTTWYVNHVYNFKNKGQDILVFKMCVDSLAKFFKDLIVRAIPGFDYPAALETFELGLTKFF